MVTARFAGVCTRGGVWSLQVLPVSVRGEVRGAWSLQVLLVSVQGEVRGHCRFCWCPFKGRCVVTAGSAGACSRRGVWSLQVLLVFQELAVGL